MPTSAGEFLAFIALVVPGWMFVKRRDRFTPAVERSDLAELVDILTISAIAWAATGLASIATTDLEIGDPTGEMPSLTDVVFTTTSTATVVEERASWGIVYLLVAASAAWYAAWLRHPHIPANLQRQTNAWRFVFKDTEPSKAAPYTRVTVRLTDSGVWIRGWMDDYPPSIKDKQNRDLVLVAPLHRIRSDGEPEPLDADYMILNERDFSSMMVTFHRTDPGITG